MSDFEKGIINAAAEVYPEAEIKCCFFHLGQALYKRVQESGLQGKYNDPDDRRIKECTHMLLSLAFVPVDDVRESFTLLKRTWGEDDDFQPVVRYFEETYVNGTPGRGRHPAVPATYAPNIWIHYQSALDRTHKTNDVSETMKGMSVF